MREIYKDRASEIVEFPPARRTLLMRRKEGAKSILESHFLWFPHMLIGHRLGSHELYCAFLTEPFNGQDEIIFPLMPNIYAGGYFAPFQVCTAYSNSVNLKPLINYMWGAPGTYGQWSGLKLTRLVFGDKLLKNCYQTWESLSLGEVIDRLNSCPEIKRSIDGTFFKRLAKCNSTIT